MAGLAFDTDGGGGEHVERGGAVQEAAATALLHAPNNVSIYRTHSQQRVRCTAEGESPCSAIKRKHVSQPSTVLVRFRQAQQASPHLALLCAPRAPQWRPQAAFRSRPRSKRRHGALAQAPTVRVHTTPRRSSTMYRVARVVGCMEVPRVQPTNRLPVITPMCMKTGFYVHEDGLLRRVGGRAGGRSYP